MPKLNLPPEFQKACRNLGQNIGYEQPTIETLVLYALSGLDRRDAVVIRRFLVDELLTSQFDDAALQEFWSSTSASIYFHDGVQLRSFLTLLKVALEQQPYVQ
jgi:hypothetical protein